MENFNNEQIMISIAIPVYNGNDTLALTLDNIIGQINENIEIIICDDFSTDKTYDIAMSYSHYDFVRVFKNDSNLGMDKNFEKTAKLCNGKFVWFFGKMTSYTLDQLRKL